MLPKRAYIQAYTTLAPALYAGTIDLIFWLIRDGIAKIAVLACFSLKMTLYIALYGAFFGKMVSDIG